MKRVLVLAVSALILVSAAQAQVKKYPSSSGYSYISSLTNVFSPSPPPRPGAVRWFYPRACHHAFIGRRFYGYYDFCCRPLLHNACIAARLRA